MSITFEVDKVKRASARRTTSPLPTVFERLVGRTLLACTDVETSLITEIPYHPLAAAVHIAFSQHRPLILTPDAVWLTIAQGFAQHVNTNSEQLRRRLVSHSGTKTLTVKTMSLETAEGWERVVDDFCLAVRRATNWNVGDLIRCDFSTTTPVTRVAGDVVLLDALQRYFEYRLWVICGIPQVTMLGTVDDWRKIERRVAALATYDLSWWTDLLLPVCKELRRTVEGDPDLDFWQCIYMPQEVYGGEVVTGWIARFFPYLEFPDDSDGAGDEHPRRPRSLCKSTRNVGLEPWKPSRSVRNATPPDPSRRHWLCRGMSLKCMPLGLSRAPILVVDASSGSTEAVQLVSGFVGVTQTRKLAVQPHIGWAVVEGHDPVAYLDRKHGVVGGDVEFTQDFRAP